MSTGCFPELDPVAEVLRAIRVERTCYCRSELSAPWGMTVCPSARAGFHFVAEGSAWLLTDGAPLRLERGDVVFLVDRPHAVASGPDVVCQPFGSLPFEPLGTCAARLVHGGGGPPTLLLSGSMQIAPEDHPLWSALPPVLLPAGGAGRSAWVEISLATLRQEVSAFGAGSDAFLTRLAELLFIDAVRGWMRQEGNRATGWLAALHDPRLGRALARLHRDPAGPVTVDGLAAQAGMSRSVFCERFREAVGVPPLQYATRLRMQLAARMLHEPGASTGSVAERLGYGSEAAFGRAFKRHMGVAPGAARRAQREPSTPAPPSLAGPTSLVGAVR